jgi:excisionase family DNA binding protein
MYKPRMAILTTAQAAERLGISVRRVQQLVKDGRLPAGQFGGALMINEEDLKLVENRKVGRPRKAEKASKKASKRKG